MREISLTTKLVACVLCLGFAGSTACGCTHVQNKRAAISLAALDTIGTIVLYRDSLATVLREQGDAPIVREGSESGAACVCYEHGDQRIRFFAGPLGGWSLVTGYGLGVGTHDSTACGRGKALSTLEEHGSVRLGLSKSEVLSRLGPAQEATDTTLHYEQEERFHEETGFDVVRVLDLKFQDGKVERLDYFKAISN